MIQTTNIDRHTYYIVDARTITPRKNVLPIIKHLLTKIISRNSCYFGFYPYLCNVIKENE